MPVDLEQAVGHTFAPIEYSWGEDDVILYHLGVGAGNPATDQNELEYTYEANLKVLPSYASIPSFPAMGGLGSTPGLEFNFAMLLHGEQQIRLERPLPTAASVTSTGRVSNIYDKGKGALVMLDVETVDQHGDLLFTNTASIFLRGEGGFGGESGPAPGDQPPDRDPDHVVESATLPQQALLYRLSGDKNPLHADPAFAAMGGFDRPILHGLCSYGIVCKAAVDSVFDGDVARVAGYKARFSGPVLPGETIVTSVWDDGDSLVLSAITKERRSPVISNARIDLTESN